MALASKITGLVVAVLMITVFFSVAKDTIPLGATAYHNLSDSMGEATEIYGTGPATFMASSDSLLGWFWVVGPFVLAIGLIVGLFLKKGRR